MILQMVNKVAGPAAAIIGTLNKLDAAALKASQRLGAMGDRLIEQGNKMKGGLIGTAALIAPVAGALKMAATWEDSLAKISTMTKMTTEQVRAKWQKDFFAIARQTGADLDDIGEAAYQALSAAVPEDQLTGFLRTAVLASKVGFTSTLNAVDGMTSAMNAFGISAENAGNLMMAAQIKGKTTINDISQNIGQLGPIAANMGMSFNEVMAALAGMTQTGSKTEQAMTGIRSIMVALAKQTDQQKQALANLGIEFTADTIRQYGFMKSMQILDTAVKKHTKTEGERAAVLNDVFGRVEGLNAAFALLSGKGLAVYNETMKMGIEDTKLMERAQEQMGNKASTNWKKLKNEIKIFSIEVGTSLLPALKDAFGGIFELIRSMQAAVQASDALKLALQILAGVIFGVIAAVKLAGVAVWAAGYAVKFAALMTKVWRAALIALKFVLMALRPIVMLLFSPAGIMIVGILAVGYGIIKLIKHWDAFTAAIRASGVAIGTFFTEIIPSAFWGLLEWLKALPSAMYDAGAKAGRAFVNGIQSIGGKAWNWIKKEAGFDDGDAKYGDFSKRFAQVGVPSAVRPVGNTVAVTLNGGINVNANGVVDIGKQAWSQLKPTLEGEIDKMNRQKSRRSMGDK